MKSLQAYISSIEPQLLQSITGKMGLLIRAIQERNFISEEALLQHICGNNRERKYYHNLKSKTKKTLQALAIVSSSKGESEIKKKLDLCRKNFTIGQKFLGKGVREEGLRLIKQGHRIAVEYNFTHLASEFSSILFYHHIYYSRKPKIAEAYAQQVERYSKAYRIEKQAEYYLYRVIANLNGTPKPKQLSEAVNQVNLLDGDSLKYQTYLSILKVLHGFNIGNYELVIADCKATLKKFIAKKGVYNTHRLFFLSKLGIAQMAVKNYSDADKTFLTSKAYIHPKTVNESIIPLYQTLNALHAGHYQKAYELYRANRKCKYEDVRQQFAIIEAYLCFLSQMGYLHLEGRFRLGKYLNDTFKAQKDKQGDNVNIIIAELLVYLARDRGKFIDRIEAVNNYSYRHLKGADTKRAKRFIKILCLLPRANFNAIALRRIAASPIRYIEEHPLSLGENISIEIIPFENLLKMIIQQLQRKVA